LSLRFLQGPVVVYSLRDGRCAVLDALLSVVCQCCAGSIVCGLRWVSHRDVVSRRSRDACLASVYMPLAHSFALAPYLILVSEFLSRTPYLQPAAAETGKHKEIERDEPEAHQRERRGIALQEFFEVDALDVVLRLLRDF